MSKRQHRPVAVEIDQAYEAQIETLHDLDGHVSDFPIVEARPQPPAQRQTWLPAQTPQQVQQAERQQVAGHLREMIDQQSQEPTPTATGNKFIIHEETNAKDRAGAGFRRWLMTGASGLPLVFGVGLWLFWGWGFFAFLFTCIGAGTLLGGVLLNWQATSQSPISIEKKQRTLDHEYRMFKEENAQRTRELIVGAFVGQARGDVERNTPTVEGQLLLVDSKNGVRK